MLQTICGKTATLLTSKMLALLTKAITANPGTAKTVDAENNSNPP